MLASGHVDALAATISTSQGYDYHVVDSAEGVPSYDVCLSFAGEERSFVERVAESLQAMGVRVFYDSYEKVTLWGKNLYDHLDFVYSQAARYCVLFVSKSYAAKVWTNHERKSAQERALRQHEEYILPVIFDETRLPGVLSTTSYIDARVTSPEELAQLIRDKLGPITRTNFLPPKPVALYFAMSAESKRDEYRIRAVASDFLEVMKRATVPERKLVIAAFTNRCSCDPVDDPHVILDYLRRVLHTTPVAIEDMARGMSSLGFISSVQHNDGEDDLHFKWRSRAPFRHDDVTKYSNLRSGEVAIEMIVQTLSHLCEDCAEHLAQTLDFSPLEQINFNLLDELLTSSEKDSDREDIADADESGSSAP